MLQTRFYKGFNLSLKSVLSCEQEKRLVTKPERKRGKSIQSQFTNVVIVPSIVSLNTPKCPRIKTLGQDVIQGVAESSETLVFHF